MRTPKRSMAAATAALFIFSLSACGDSDKGDDKGSDKDDKDSSSSEEPEGPAADASEDDFCGAFSNEDLAEVDEEDFEAQADALHDYADALEDVGTPDDIPDDARDGYEVLLEAYRDIEAGDLEDEDAQADLEEKYKDDQDDIEAFFTYATEKCVPEGLPSDVPSE